jgi:hypothetical protein
LRSIGRPGGRPRPAGEREDDPDEHLVAIPPEQRVSKALLMVMYLIFLQVLTLVFT